MKCSGQRIQPASTSIQVSLLLLALFQPCCACAQAYSGTLLDAVQVTLLQDASIASGRLQMTANQGLLLSARAPFDPVWTAGISQQKTVTPLPASGGDVLDSSQMIYQAGLSQRLASGVVINPTVSITRVHDESTNYTSPSIGNVALNVIVPLRKGAGSEVVTAPVTAATLSLDASRNSYIHIRGQAVVQTVNAYWEVVAASKTLEIASQAESRAEELLVNARKLAHADEIPKADLLKYEVRRVAQNADRLSAALQLSQALQALSQAMNAPIESLSPALHGLDAFPKAEDARLGLLDDPAGLARFLTRSAERRTDLRAAEQSLRAANTLADAAQRNSGSQLDLSFSVGYNGLTEGSAGATTLRALGRPAGGANIGMQLNYTLPSGDSERQGLIMQRNSAAEQAQTNLDALRLRASRDAITQLDALRAATAQLDKASTQLRLQTTIFENEKRSYQAGLSTLLDLFTTESQLTAYQTGWVQAQRNFAQALVLFRFQTASLFAPVAGGSDFDPNTLQPASLTTLPEELYN